MWKTLSIVAAILTAGAAFFSFKNVEQFKNERLLLTIAKKNQADSDAHLKKVKAALAADIEGRKKTEGERDALSRQIEELAGKIKALSDQITAKKTELDEVTARWSQVKKDVDGLGGIQNLITQVTSLTQEKSSLDEKIVELNTKATLATERFNNLTKVIAAKKTTEAWQARGIIEDNFRASLVQVDRNYGFMTINAGNARGVVSGATLDIKRGGSVVGQARVTNVEQRYAVADLVEGSGITPAELQVGDTVTVAASSRASTWRENQKRAEAAPAPTQPAAKPDAAAPVAPAPGTPADPFAPAPAAPTEPATPGTEKPAEAPADKPAEQPADPFAK